MAEVTEQSPLQMDPLAEAIDPDALNTLFYGRADSASSLAVTFEYCGSEVTVTTNGGQAVHVATGED